MKQTPPNRSEPGTVEGFELFFNMDFVSFKKQPMHMVSDAQNAQKVFFFESSRKPTNEENQYGIWPKNMCFQCP